MEPPIGFVALRDAVDVVGRKVNGPGWRPIGNTADYDAHVHDRDAFRAAYNLDADGDRVITLIAEQCEAGGMATAYRSLAGADSLDRGVWRLPCWRDYFATGTIDLDLPLLDEQGRPNTNGYTARCTREVFVRRQDLDGVVATLSRPNVSPAGRTNKKQIAAIVTSYRQSLSADASPSIPDLGAFPKRAA